MHPNREKQAVAERVTLLTGASSGIGAELARIFAANRHRVVLVARRADLLKSVADKIMAAGGAEPIIIACDLAARDACDLIAAELAARDLEVEYVINNAGYGLFGKAAVMDRHAQLEMLDLNIRTLTDLSLRFSESLIRLRGGILNVGSIASFLPGPGMAAYYASKAYVLSFTEALHAELSPQGVRVTALCPGPVQSGFQARAGFKPGMDSAALAVSAADVALAGYRGLMAGKCVVLPGTGNSIIPFLLRLVPRSLVRSAVSRIQLRRV